MIPVLEETIPAGDDWGYQLKWDGVRIIAAIGGGRAELYSRRMLPKNTVYPEIARELSALKGTLVVDGEVVVFDRVKQRPVFQKVLQRERTRQAAAVRRSSEVEPAMFVAFDLLQLGTQDLRKMPYAERYRLLKETMPPPSPTFLVTDMFNDGQALWRWVQEREWEGIVSKKLSGPYKEGKKHRDWLKKKTSIRLEVTIAGFTIRENNVASLVMVYEGVYFGRVSLGLTVRMKSELLAFGRDNETGASPFGRTLPADLKGETLLWLGPGAPISCEVTGLEITSDGMLRHPKLVRLAIENRVLFSL